MHIRCTNCGADVPIGQSTREVVCAFCQTLLFVGRQKGIPHYVMSAHMSSDDAVLQLRRFLSTREITLPIRVVEKIENYLPYWQLHFIKGRRPALVLAHMSLVDDLISIDARGGETGLKSAEDIADHLLVEPQLQLEDAMGVAKCASSDLDGEKAPALVHIPFVKIRYEAAGEILEAYVDQVAGEVYADVLPPSPQRQKSRALALVAAGALLLVAGVVTVVPWAVQLLLLPLLLFGLYVGIMKLLGGLGW